jgi:hypothetical protein
MSSGISPSSSRKSVPPLAASILPDHAAAPRTGEGPFGVTEQLRREQFARQTAAVDYNEWGRLRTAAIMDALGEHFLPDPRFAQQ